ncbi:MAG TPA: GNAT family N-acetyltransferase [Egicoccus sp.]|nr:GNAT family N-acetyltransferase [Egicoccus sp.]HSK24361.1 GNAT family N-acetyltransferase [Egicoccus sp.]
MSRRLVPLHGDVVEELPWPCRECLFWELGGACPGRTGPVAKTHDGDDPLTRKQAWASALVQDGRHAGRVVKVDDEVAAHAVFAPVEAFARRPAFVPSPTPGSLLLATVWVQPQWRGLGLGRLLVQAALKEAIRLDLPAVEAYGDRRWHERECYLPATWLLHEGFEVHGEHPRTPLLRIDARRTLRWAESLEHALEEMLAHLPRRVRTPVPAPAQVSRHVGRDDEYPPVR